MFEIAVELVSILDFLEFMMFLHETHCAFFKLSDSSQSRYWWAH